MQFSDDGAQVVSGSDDNTVRMWDVASGTQMHLFSGGIFALVEGPSDLQKIVTDALTTRVPSGEKHTNIRHVLTAYEDMLLIHRGTSPIPPP